MSLELNTKIAFYTEYANEQNHIRQRTKPNKDHTWTLVIINSEHTGQSTGGSALLHW